MDTTKDQENLDLRRDQTREENVKLRDDRKLGIEPKCYKAHHVHFFPNGEGGNLSLPKSSR